MALFLLLGAAEAGLPHVQQQQDLAGQPAQVRHVRCQADGKPDTLADLYLVRQGRQYRIARLEYNEGARAVLDGRQAFPVTRRAYERYVLGGEPFSEFSMNALLGLWRALGMRYRLDGTEYRCRVD